MLDRIIRRMDATPRAVGTLASGLTTDEARSKPPSGAWSILEIVCHMVDEETADFRPRLELTLRDPGAPWPDLDPEAAAVKREYLSQDLPAKLQEFADERAKTIAWLRSLRSPNWQAAHVHPRFGPIRAGDLLCAWPAHDALHIRQIAKRLYELAGREGETMSPATPFITRYAGDWGP